MTNESEPPGGNDPLRRARAALLDHLPKDRILDCYAKAGGQELISGKFMSPASSACLAANAFGFYLDRPAALYLPPALVMGGRAHVVSLESQMRFPWSGGLHPWLDAHVETDADLIGIESKRYEPFRDRKSVDFSEAYARPVWGERMAPFEAMRAALHERGEKFEFLDAAQLVKHAFGLRTQGEKRNLAPHLVYLYAEPKALPDGKSIAPADIEQHRAEVDRFSHAVAGAEVGFSSLRYRDLLATWAGDPDDGVRAHAQAVLRSFDV